MYSKAVAKMIREVKKPKHFTMDVVEHPDYLELRVYENEIMAMPDNVQQDVVLYMVKIKSMLAAMGIRAELGGVAGDPPKSV